MGVPNHRRETAIIPAHLGVLALFVVGMLAGCAFTPGDGQFRCGVDNRCPPGFSCIAGLCRASLDGSDSIDVGPMDAAPGDGPPVDGSPSDAGFDGPPPDVPPRPEDCAPGPSGPVDEDVDGLIDEECPYRMGIAHSPVEVHRRYSWHFGAELTRGGTRLWFAASIPGVLSYADRPSLDARFGRPIDVPVPVPMGSVIQISSITDDEAEAFLQVRSMEGYDIYRAVLSSDPIRVVSVEPVSADGARLNAAGSVVEPTIQRDGLALAFVDDFTSRVMEVRRSTRGGAFGPPTQIAMGRLPSYGPNGVLFVFTPTGVEAVSPGSRVMTPFGRRPFYHPPTREVLFVAEVGSGASDAPGIMRAEVCRTDTEGCTAPPPCPAPMMGTADGAHCFFTQTASPFPATCTSSATLGPHDRLRPASLHLASEQTLVAGLVTADSWLGLQRALVTFQWTSTEPLILTNWGAGEPAAVGDCVLFSAAGGAGTWHAASCADSHPVLCELDRWPTWAPDGG